MATNKTKTFEEKYMEDTFWFNKIKNRNVVVNAKTVLVIQDRNIAVELAKTKQVIYISFEKEKVDLFNRLVLICPEFGGDDKAYFVRYDIKNKEKEIKEIIEKCGIKKFDVVIGNPPYEGKTKLYLRILNEIRNYSDNIIWLCPTNWIDKPIEWMYENRDVALEASKNKLSENLIEGKFFLEQGVDENVGIFVWLKNKQKIDCNTLWKRIYKNSNYIESIINKFNKLPSNIGDYMIRCGKNNKKVNQTFAVTWSSFSAVADNIPKFIGYAIIKGITKIDAGWIFKEVLVSSSKSSNSLNGAYRGLHDQYFIPFNDKNECENFLEYIKSPIVMFAWNLKQTQSKLIPANSDFIPWMNFDHKITDEEIIEKIGLTDEEYQYICEEMKQYM